MSTVAGLEAIIVSLILFMLSGIGISLYSISPQQPHRFWYALCLSPTIGLTIVGFCLNFLWNSLDVSIDSIAVLVAAGSIFLNLSLLGLYFSNNLSDFGHHIPWRLLLLGFFCLICILTLLVLPGSAGIEYRYWQGNARDASNYVIIAWTSQHYSADEVLNPAFLEKQEVLSLAPGIALPKVVGRPVVGYLLAWISSLIDIEVYNLYYYFKLTLLLCAFSALLTLGRFLDMHKARVFAAAAVCVTGAWAYYLSDSDALSQLSIFSIEVILLSAWIQQEKNATYYLISRERFFLGFSLGAHILFYPEFIYLLVAVTFIYYLLRLLDRASFKDILRSLLPHLITIIIAIIPQITTINTTINYLQSQKIMASGEITASWHKLYFQWLYTRYFLADICGLYYYRVQLLIEGFSFETIKFFVMTIASILLLSFLIYGIIRCILDRYVQVGHKMLAAFVVVFWGGGYFTYLAERDWVAGKLLVGGSPFIILAIFCYTGLLLRDNTALRLSRNLVQPITVNGLLLVWTLSQIAIPILRYKEAQNNEGEFKTYPPIQNVMVTKILPILDYIEKHDVALVVTDFDKYYDHALDPWTVMLADSVSKQQAINGTPWYAAQKHWSQLDEIPSYWIVSENRDYFSNSGLGQRLAGESGAVSLYTITPEEIDQLLSIGDLLNPAAQPLITDMNAPIRDENGYYVRQIQGSPIVRFVASGQTDLTLFLGYTSDYNGEFTISLNGLQLIKQNVMQGSPYQTDLCLNPKKGINTLSFLTKGNTVSEAILLTDFQFSSISENMTIDLGFPQDTPFIQEGWYLQEEWQGDEFRWAKQEADLRIITCPMPVSKEYNLEFRALNLFHEQDVTIKVNGETIGKIPLEFDWHTYSVPIPAELIAATDTINIELIHKHVSVPSTTDYREMSVAYDWFTLESK